MSRFRVLWIEDDDRLETHVHLLRNKYGFDVVWIRSLELGEEVIRGQDSFDIILFDFEFFGSDRDGSDLVSIKRQCEHRQSVPEVLLSIKVVKPNEYKIIDGGTHCLGKPISPERLAAAIDAIIGGKDVRSVLRRK